MATLTEHGAGPGAPVIAQVRASICDAVGRVICPPGLYECDGIREIVGNRDFARLENAGVIRILTEGE